MRAIAIVLKGDVQSEACWEKLRQSHYTVGNKFEINAVKAFTPRNIDAAMRFIGVKWTYPDEEEVREVDGALLRLKPYKNGSSPERKACFLSHLGLWLAAMDEPILILEDDALFVRRLDPQPILDSPYQIIGINDPRGATRLPQVYHERVQNANHEIQDAPWIDDPCVPQGLAGASAYLVKPAGGKKALNLVARYNGWPNDALLCKQLCPGMLGQTKTYYTKVQGRPSQL